MKLSSATVKQHTGNAKTIFNEAVRQGLVTEAPFRHLKGGATASRNTHHVTASEAEAVLDACPDLQWRLVFALGRYAGLRIPSESHLLTWADVDWQKGRLRVRCVKTEHHAGHEVRFVPITDKHMPILQDAFDAAKPGDERIVTMNHGGQSHRALRRIVERAGVQPWEDAFQTLRRRCEKEWAMTFPLYAVSKWIGHSIVVSGRHYANDVPDELFDRAAAHVTPPVEKQALQNALQHAAAPRCTDMNAPRNGHVQNAKTREDFASMRDVAEACKVLEQWSRGESNPRADTVDQRHPRVSSIF
jgi:integrase